MMMAKIDMQLSDPIAAERAFARRHRDQALEAALREGMRRCSFARPGGAEPRWYVLAVRRRTEESVAETVEKLGLKTWVPMGKSLPKRVRGRMRDGVDTPVFERFVFVELVGNAYAWLVLGALPDVVAILGSETGPLPVPVKKMNALRKMEEAGVFALAKNARERAKALIATDYPIGSTVEIGSGPFELFEAVIEGYVHTRAVRAMVNLFGRLTPVELDIDQIRRLA